MKLSTSKRANALESVIVLLMAAKPDLWESISIVELYVVLGLLSSLLACRRSGCRDSDCRQTATSRVRLTTQ